jgi:cell wall-associated NlpC family hydrolase
MQFLPATFAAYNHPTPPGGAVPASPYDAVDAVHAAARYLCASGARDGADIPAAVFAYNHSSDYQAQVLAIARGYAADAASADAADTAAKAVAFVRAQLGVPYVWGGDGPAILADLLDLKIRTAEAWAWATYAQHDWSAYLAARTSTTGARRSHTDHST